MLDAEAGSFLHISQDSGSNRFEFIGIRVLPRVSWGVAVEAWVVLGLSPRGSIRFLNIDYVDVFRK